MMTFECCCLCNRYGGRDAMVEVQMTQAGGIYARRWAHRECMPNGNREIVGHAGIVLRCPDCDRDISIAVDYARVIT